MPEEIQVKETAPEASDQVVWLDLGEWKQRAADDDIPENAGLRKVHSGGVTKAEGEGEEPYRFDWIISGSAERDRDRDLIEVSGWDWKDYLAGGPGPVLWAHQHSTIPLGKSQTIRRIEQALVADVTFPTPEEAGYGPDDPHLQKTVRRLVMAEYLKSASVGFLPTEWTFNEEEAGFDFKRQELLEWSIVPVPAYPGAFRLAGEKGLDMAPIDQWARKWLDETIDSPAIFIARAKVGDALKSLGFDEDATYFDIGEAGLKTVLAELRRTDEEGSATEVEEKELEADAKQKASDDGTTDTAPETREAVESLLKQIVDRLDKLEAKAAPETKSSDELITFIEEPEPIVQLVTEDGSKASDSDFLKAIQGAVTDALNEETPETGRVY